MKSNKQTMTSIQELRPSAAPRRGTRLTRTSLHGKHQRRALHGLVIVGVLVAVAVAMTFALTGGIQDNLDSMTGTNRIAITDINAYTAGDRLVVTGNLQNLGSQPLDSVTIDEITAGDLVITQVLDIEDGNFAGDHGDLTLSGNNGLGAMFDGVEDAYGAGAGIGAGGTPPNTYPAITADEAFWGASATPTASTPWWRVDLTGLSLDEGNLEGLAAGSSKSFRIVVTGSNTQGNLALDVGATVPASTSLFMTVAATDGQTSTISDPRSVRVTAR